MTDRYTRKDAEKAFERICSLLGKERGHYVKHAWDDPVAPGAVALPTHSIHTVARYHTQPGAWTLDYSSVYGGYQITEILPDSTGVTLPLGERRRSARELWQLAHDLQELSRRGLIRTAQDVAS